MSKESTLQFELKDPTFWPVARNTLTARRMLAESNESMRGGIVSLETGALKRFLGVIFRLRTSKNDTYLSFLSSEKVTRQVYVIQCSCNDLKRSRMNDANCQAGRKYRDLKGTSRSDIVG